MKQKRLNIENVAALESFWTDEDIFQFGFYMSGLAFIARNGFLISYSEVPLDEFPVLYRSKLADFVHDMFVYQLTKYHIVIKISPNHE